MDRQDDFENELNGELDERPRWRRWALRGAGALALLLVGAAAGAVWSERRVANKEVTKPAAEPAASMPAMPGMPAASKSTPQTAPRSQTASPSDGAQKAEEALEVSLPPEAVTRAGLKVATVRTERLVQPITVPGTLSSNVYRDTKVAALVGGVVRQVLVELGSPVKRGQPLAVIFSNELAEAQMKYLSMQAMLHADHQKVKRTEKLVAIGAASRQELEEVQAVRDARESEVAAARQRLLLLGLTPQQVDRVRGAGDVVSDVTVPAPVDGVIITRAVNPGQVVMQGNDLFVVTDLSTVWAIGDLYEKDFGQVRVGTEATVMLPSGPSRRLTGRVAYIDPRVDQATRTAKIRVEVPNRNGELRLGMYVNVSFQAGPERAVSLVPRAALQSVGERTVVYLPVQDGEGRFVERPVKLGQAVGDFVEVVEGLKPGEKVVTEGSFFLRAEAARLRSSS
ncbi:MAG: efflux RND transporter periplasmic adaptor subunit [Candidatus Rokuibacteriota bacterium]